MCEGVGMSKRDIKAKRWARRYYKKLRGRFREGLRGSVLFGGRRYGKLTLIRALAQGRGLPGNTGGGE